MDGPSTMRCSTGDGWRRSAEVSVYSVGFVHLSGLGFLPRNINLSMFFFFFFFESFFENYNAKRCNQNDFWRCEIDPSLSSWIQWKTKWSLSSPFFFLPSSFYSLHSLFSKIKNPPIIRPCVRPPLSVFVYTHSTASLEQWNDNQDKIVQRRALRICFVWEVSVLYTRNVRLTIYHSVLFFCPFSGFANIFEIKCNCFFKLN